MIKEFSEATAVAGNEKSLRNIIENIFKDKDYDISTDTIGNLTISTTKKTALPVVSIYAHMDEPGIIVTEITKDGYLKFDTIGKIETSSLVSQHIKIGKIKGIISLKAVHLTTKEERQKPVKLSSLFIDIGATSKKDAEALVSPGDYGSFDTDYTEYSDKYIKGKALASRVSCAILGEILMNADKYNFNICATFTVQKEIYARGAIVSAFYLPDVEYVILLDSDDATDNKENTLKAGDGVAICVYKNIPEGNLCMLSDIEKEAEKKNISYQKSVIQKESEVYSLLSHKPNIQIIPFNIPCKFIHTGVNVVYKQDIKSTKEMIEMLLRRNKNV